MKTAAPVVPAPRAEGGAPFTFTELLDALPDAAAVLGDDGAILAVNRTWRRFAEDNGGDAEATGVGVNYLEVCARSAAAGCEDAAKVEEALRSVLTGSTVDSVLDYPCPSPGVGRWFALRVTPIVGASRGVLVSHTNITRRKMAELDLQRQASQDPLTGLANRARFEQRLKAALTPRRGREPRADVGLIYLDLDGFKPVNDVHGHGAGDELLQAVAGRLLGLVRSQDTVARIGGDEFAVVVPRISAASLAALATRLEEVLREPHVVHGHVVEVSASVGCHLVQPGETVPEAVQRADEAMYAVKRSRQLEHG